MINFKWGIIAAAGAFIVSFGIGLLSGVAIIHVILRAFIFAVVFFGVGFGLKFVANNFFPEMSAGIEGFEGTETYEQQAGQRVNIVLDTAGEYAVPELFKSPGAPDELGNINDLVSGRFRPPQEGVDRFGEESYNQNEGFGMPEAEPASFQNDFIPQPVSYEKPQAEKPAFNRQDFNPSFGDGSDGLGGLPDLDAMAMAFSPGGGHSSDAFTPTDSFNGVFSSGSSDDYEPESSGYVGNKPQPLKGDFNPKELAEGIRTVLAKEK